MSQEIYYKATRAHGMSAYDSNFVYRLGMNVHPKPDRSNEVCSDGIHLAKTIGVAKRLCKGWKEIYEAKAGVILGEDIEKIRVASCMLLRRLEGDIDFNMPKRPSLNDEWLDKHASDITMADILSQKLEVLGNGKVIVSLKANMKAKERRYILKTIVKKASHASRATLHKEE